MNYGTKIAKGTMVWVMTTNGGVTLSRLLETYRPTYDAVIESGNSYARIPATRIASVEPFNGSYIEAFRNTTCS